MMKLSNYKLIMFALVVFLLFQFYFAFYYLLGEGASNGSPIMGLLSLILAFIVIAIMLSIRHYFKKHK